MNISTEKRYHGVMADDVHVDARLGAIWVTIGERDEDCTVVFFRDVSEFETFVERAARVLRRLKQPIEPAEFGCTCEDCER
jgi:hypothetical protein